MDLSELPNLAQTGWGGAAALVIGLLLFLFVKRAKKEDEAVQRRREQEAELARHEAAHVAALHRGDAVAVVEEKRIIDELRKGLGLLCAVAALLLSGGCASQTKIVVLSEHCRTITPGETVPDYPNGETVYWLATPTGLRMMLPAGSAVPKEGGAK